jgi:hypothetical protein
MKPTTYLRAAVCAALMLGVPAADASAAKKRTSKRRAPQGTTASANFRPVCRRPNYPQPPPATSPAIDAQCGLAGSGSGAEGAQNSAKNNFCATGTPRAVTIPSLTTLQSRVEKNPSINFGDENSTTRQRGPTTNRAPLQRLGEGRLVTLKAYVLRARQEGGESVNCGQNVPNQAPFHDIHISLVAAPQDYSEAAECSGVVAEMSPHHRPDSWTAGNVNKVAAARALVRVTGQLFFDSSHEPCQNGQPVRSNPKRVALWEIHPVYKFEVCTANCSGAGRWLPLDRWLKQN